MASFQEQTRDRLREALLDAAYDAVVADRAGRVSMAAVAAGAGVSRQTLYNEFGSRDGLAQALALRESGRVLDGVVAALAEHEGHLAAGVAAAVEFALRRAADDPLAKVVLGGHAEGDLLLFLTTRGQPLLEQAREAIAGYARGHLPDLPPTDIEVLVDVVVRLTHSNTVLPYEPAEVVAARIARLVDRFISGGHA